MRRFKYTKNGLVFEAKCLECKGKKGKLWIRFDGLKCSGENCSFASTFDKYIEAQGGDKGSGKVYSSRHPVFRVKDNKIPKMASWRPKWKI